MKNNIFYLFLYLICTNFVVSQSLEYVVPDTAKQGEQLNVTITGHQTDWWTTDYMNVSFGEGIEVSNLSLVNDTTLNSTIDIAKNAMVGSRNVFVSWDYGYETLYEGFTVKDSILPTISYIEPSQAEQGVQNLPINIYSEDTDWSITNTDSLDVGFSGEDITIESLNVISQTHLRILISIGYYAIDSSRDIWVSQYTNDNLIFTDTLKNSFSVKPLPPSLVEVVPEQGRQGDNLEVTITGHKTDWWTTDYMNVSFGEGIEVSNLSLANDTTLNSTIAIAQNAIVGSRNVFVSWDYGDETLSLYEGFTVQDSILPTISYIEPSQAEQGVQNLPINIYGEDVDWQNNEDYNIEVEFSGNDIIVDSIEKINETQLEILINVSDFAETSFRDIIIYQFEGNQVIDSLIEVNIFQINESPPEILSIEPSHGSPGENLEVTITGHNTDWVNSPYSNSLDMNFEENDILIYNETIISKTEVIADINIDDSSVIENKTLSVISYNSWGSFEYEIFYDGFTVQTNDVMTEIINYDPGWNIVSVPLSSDNMNVDNLYPSASSNAFTFQDNYQIADELENGSGYWLKFDQAGSTTVTGSSVSIDVPVSTGWNLIGVFDQLVNVNSITSEPSGIIASNFFGYEDSYYFADQLQVGDGYWIKVDQSGTLSYTGKTAKAATNIAGIGDDWGKIKVTDRRGKAAELYVGKEVKNKDVYQLPPEPPEGEFDVRYSDDSYVMESSEGTKVINLNGCSFPIEISAEGTNLQLSAAGIEKLLKSGETLELGDESIRNIEIRTTMTPTEYVLKQNYPNPFNPTTKIKYGIKQAGKVNLTIYNSLGEEVVELINKEMEPGYYETKFNANNFSSGVYIYRLKVNDFVKVRKMLLLK